MSVAITSAHRGFGGTSRAVAVLAIILPVMAFSPAVAGPSGDRAATVTCAAVGDGAVDRRELDRLCAGLTRVLTATGHRVLPDGPTGTPPPHFQALQLEVQHAGLRKVAGRLSVQDCRDGTCRDGGQSPVLTTVISDAPRLPVTAIDDFLRNLLRLAQEDDAATTGQKDG